MGRAEDSRKLGWVLLGGARAMAGHPSGPVREEGLSDAEAIICAGRLEGSIHGRR